MRNIAAGSRVFTIFAGEGRDCSNKEQMPIIIRYMDEAHNIREDFLALVECEHGTTGAQLCS